MGIKIFGQNILKGVKHDNNLAVFSPGPSVESEGQTYRIQQRHSWFSNIGTKRKTLVPFVWFSPAFLDDSQVGGICFGPKWQDCPTISVWECIKGLKPSLGCKHLPQPSPGTGCSFLESTHLFKQPGIAWVSKLGISIRPEALVANWCKYIPLFQNSQQTEYREFHFNRIEFLLWSGMEFKLLKIPASKVKKKAVDIFVPS